MTIQPLHQPGEVAGTGDRDVLYHLGFRFMKCLSMESLLQMVFIFSESPIKLYLAKAVMEGEIDSDSTKGSICQVTLPLRGSFPIR